MASVVEPGSVDEVATLLRDASRDGLAVLPRGGGTKLDWGRPPRRADLVLSTTRLDRVLEHAWADMTATVEAGCTVARLQHALAEQGQRLACDPLWPERATIGGILATNDHGPPLCELALAIQGSQLAFVSLQVRAGGSVEPGLDVAFEGTRAGLDSQQDELLRLAASVTRVDPPASVWRAREALWQGTEPAVVGT